MGDTTRPTAAQSSDRGAAKGQSVAGETVSLARVDGGGATLPLVEVPDKFVLLKM